MSLVPLARVEAADGQQHSSCRRVPRRSRSAAPSPGVKRSPTVFGTTTTRSGGMSAQASTAARVCRDTLSTRSAASTASRRNRDGAAPDLDPVRLDDQPGACEAGDRRRERRQMQMAAEHDDRAGCSRAATTAPSA